MHTLFLKGQPIGSIKGVLFDKDGTLSNSEGHLLNLAKLRVQEATRVLNKEIKSALEIKKLEELLSKAYGMSNKGISPNGTIAIASRENNLISTATVLCLLGETWPQALELSRQIFQLADVLDGGVESSPERRILLPGVRKILQALQSEGVTCALISNDSCFGIQSFLSRNDLKELINHYWSADNHPTKPDPEAVKRLCSNLGLHPSECALIGDADSDLLMARQAGIGLILGYTGGWTQKPKLTKHQYLFNNWNELTIRQSKH